MPAERRPCASQDVSNRFLLVILIRITLFISAEQTGARARDSGGFPQSTEDHSDHSLVGAAVSPACPRPSAPQSHPQDQTAENTALRGQEAPPSRSAGAFLCAASPSAVTYRPQVWLSRSRWRALKRSRNTRHSGLSGNCSGGGQGYRVMPRIGSACARIARLAGGPTRAILRAG